MDKRLLDADASQNDYGGGWTAAQKDGMATFVLARRNKSRKVM